MRASSIAFVGVVMLSSGGAFAQQHGSPAPSANSASEALAAYSRGVTQYDHHDFQAALASFRQSFQLVPSPNSGLYVARCQRELGDLAAAEATYQQTFDDATQRARTEARYVGTRDAARDELHALSARLGHLRIDLASTPESARVLVDGHEVPRATLARLLAVNPGRIAVRVEAEGFQPFTQDVEVAAGAEATVPVQLTRVTTTVASVAPRATTPSTHGTLELNPLPRNLALVGAGLAVLGAVGFITFGVAANSSYNDLSQRCGNAPCADPADRSIAQTGRTYDTLANVSLGVGIVGLVAGAAMLVWSIRTGTRHEVTVGSNGTSLILGGRF